MGQEVLVRVDIEIHLGLDFVIVGEESGEAVPFIIHPRERKCEWIRRNRLERNQKITG